MDKHLKNHIMRTKIHQVKLVEMTRKPLIVDKIRYTFTVILQYLKFKNI